MTATWLWCTGDIHILSLSCQLVLECVASFFFALQIPLFLVPSYHVNLAAHKLRHGRVDVSEIGRHRHMQDLNIPQSEEVDPAVTKAMFGARIFLRLLWLGIDGHLVRSQWIVMEQDV